MLTVSDSSARGEREDLSGPAVAEVLCTKQIFKWPLERSFPTSKLRFAAVIAELAAQARLVVTTGGTGIAQRDVTPEATRAVCDRLLEGVAERMRTEGAKKTPFAALSRGVCGVKGESIILNVPGKSQGCS